MSDDEDAIDAERTKSGDESNCDQVIVDMDEAERLGVDAEHSGVVEFKWRDAFELASRGLSLSNGRSPSCNGVLACCYFYGQGTTKDASRGVACARNALAVRVVPIAQSILGIAMLTGDGVDRDTVPNCDARGIELVRSAAEADHNYGLTALGWCTMHGVGGLQADNVAAYELFQRAADKNDAVGLFNVGHMLTVGRGIDRDLAGGAEFFRRSAEKGYVMGSYSYARCLMQGEGVELDNRGAALMFEEAVDRGYKTAAYWLAVVLERAEIAERDEVAITHWYETAARANDRHAQIAMGYRCRNGIGIEQSLSAALRWYDMAEHEGAVALRREIETHNRRNLRSLLCQCYSVCTLEERAMVPDVTVELIESRRTPEERLAATLGQHEQDQDQDQEDDESDTIDQEVFMSIMSQWD
jgi:TPR repeat protein